VFIFETKRVPTCISKIGVDILSFFLSHVGTLFVSNINALTMLLSSQNINYNSTNKFKCPLNTGNPEVSKDEITEGLQMTS